MPDMMEAENQMVGGEVCECISWGNTDKLEWFSKRKKLEETDSHISKGLAQLLSFMLYYSLRIGTFLRLPIQPVAD